MGGKKKEAGAREHGFGLLDWWRASHDGRNTYKYVLVCTYNTSTYGKISRWRRRRRRHVCIVHMYVCSCVWWYCTY